MTRHYTKNALKTKIIIIITHVTTPTLAQNEIRNFKTKHTIHNHKVNHCNQVTTEHMFTPKSTQITIK